MRGGARVWCVFACIRADHTVLLSITGVTSQPLNGDCVEKQNDDGLECDEGEKKGLRIILLEGLKSV